mmetsp:Transcript_14026/g.35821  ORF Transcript_14026/g.35821 Transcript_14026/m.35821 type:complete len:325 (+) Transcript_14026:1551-2525(+)
MVNEVAVGEEGEGVKHVKDLEARLVDREDDGAAMPCKALQEREDLARSRGIQACCGLIKEEHRGRRDQLHANVDALALPPADAADKLVAHLALRYLVEPEFVDDVLHAALFLVIRDGPWEAKLCAEHQVLPHGERPHDNVVLDDVPRVVLEALRVPRGPVDKDGPLHSTRVLAIREHVEQRRLTPPGGTHDGVERAGLDAPRAVCEDVAVNHLFGVWVLDLDSVCDVVEADRAPLGEAHARRLCDIARVRGVDDGRICDLLERERPIARVGMLRPLLVRVELCGSGVLRVDQLRVDHGGIVPAEVGVGVHGRFKRVLRPALRQL